MWWVGESHLLVVEVLAEKERCGGWKSVMLAEKEVFLTVLVMF